MSANETIITDEVNIDLGEDKLPANIHTNVSVESVKEKVKKNKKKNKKKKKAIEAKEFIHPRFRLVGTSLRDLFLSNNKNHWMSFSCAGISRKVINLYIDEWHVGGWGNVTDGEYAVTLDIKDKFLKDFKHAKLEGPTETQEIVLIRIVMALESANIVLHQEAICCSLC